MAGDFNSQNIANFIWAINLLRVPASSRLLTSLASRAQSLGNLLML